MTLNDLLYWGSLILLAFAFALAVQMRIMGALVLRRALIAWNKHLDRMSANKAVAWAVGQKDLPEEAKPWLVDSVKHLRKIYVRPLKHIRLARQVSVLAPILIVALVGAVRFGT
ncbi:MAG: hypothetical protein AAGJ29_12485 [Pseudomonadota bacterium]